jgi:hypothetical protein
MVAEQNQPSQSEPSQWDIDVGRAVKFHAELRRKLWRRVWVAVGLLTILAAAWTNVYRQYHKHPLVGGFPPHVNKDGTIDYSVIGWGPTDEKTRNTSITKLVLRLNDAYHVSYPLNAGAKLSYSGSGFTIAPNRFGSLVLYMRWPRLEPTGLVTTAIGVEGSDKNMISVDIDGERRSVLWDAARDRIAKDCKTVPTQLKFNGPETAVEFDCPTPGAKRQFFEVRSGGKVMAVLDCASKSKNKSCQSSFQIISRTASLDIALENLADYPQIQRDVEDFLSKVVVRDSFETIAPMTFTSLIFGD